MNAWMLAALLLMVAGVPLVLVVASRGEPLRRLIGANLLSTVLVGALLLLSQGLGRSSYVDVALVLAVLAPTGTLVFTRLLTPDRRSEDRTGKEPEAADDPP